MGASGRPAYEEDEALLPLLVEVPEVAAPEVDVPDVEPVLPELLLEPASGGPPGAQ